MNRPCFDSRNIHEIELFLLPNKGDTYWKGFFIQCRTDYSVGGITCHNYQFPWFLMDGVLLSNRILYVLAWIFMITVMGK